MVFRIFDSRLKKKKRFSHYTLCAKLKWFLRALWRTKSWCCNHLTEKKKLMTVKYFQHTSLLGNAILTFSPIEYLGTFTILYFFSHFYGHLNIWTFQPLCNVHARISAREREAFKPAYTEGRSPPEALTPLRQDLIQGLRAYGSSGHRSRIPQSAQNPGLPVATPFSWLWLEYDFISEVKRFQSTGFCFCETLYSPIALN